MKKSRLIPASLMQPSSSEDQAWRELNALLEQRIEDGLSGKVSDRSIDAVFEEELGSDSSS